MYSGKSMLWSAGGISEFAGALLRRAAPAGAERLAEPPAAAALNWRITCSSRDSASPSIRGLRDAVQPVDRDEQALVIGLAHRLLSTNVSSDHGHHGDLEPCDFEDFGREKGPALR